MAEGVAGVKDAAERVGAEFGGRGCGVVFVDGWVAEFGEEGEDRSVVFFGFGVDHFVDEEEGGWGGEGGEEIEVREEWGPAEVVEVWGIL